MTRVEDVVWRRADALAVVESPDRIAILDLDHLAEPPRILTDSAAEIWRAVDGVRTTALIVTAVASSFEVDATEIHADVVAFLQSLDSSGLLEAS